MKQDVNLVDEALAKPEAFAHIVQHYKNIVFGVALSRIGNFHDAEDVAQNVFIEAFERLDTLKDPNRLGAWLRSIAIHRCINHIQRKPPVNTVEHMDDLIGDTPTPHMELEKKDLRDQVLSAINTLSKKQQETVTLFYISGHSQQEIADIQEVPLGTIKRRLHDARNALKTEMLKVVENTLKSEAPKEDFNERVFNLLRRYNQPWPKWPYTDLKKELEKIGIDGIEGFAQAIELPHAQTRKFTIQMSGFVHDMAQAANSERQEVIISVLKKALSDPNKKVRRNVVTTLLSLNVDKDRVSKEFLPLIIPQLEDPTQLVRQRAAWELTKWAADVPLEDAALALANAPDTATHQAIGRLVKEIVKVQKAPPPRPPS